MGSVSCVVGAEVDGDAEEMAGPVLENASWVVASLINGGLLSRLAGSAQGGRQASIGKWGYSYTCPDGNHVLSIYTPSQGRPGVLFARVTWDHFPDSQLEKRVGLYSVLSSERSLGDLVLDEGGDVMEVDPKFANIDDRVFQHPNFPSYRELVQDVVCDLTGKESSL